MTPRIDVTNHSLANPLGEQPNCQYCIQSRARKHNKTHACAFIILISRIYLFVFQMPTRRYNNATPLLAEMSLIISYRTVQNCNL